MSNRCWPTKCSASLSSSYRFFFLYFMRIFCETKTEQSHVPCQSSGHHKQPHAIRLSLIFNSNKKLHTNIYNSGVSVESESSGENKNKRNNIRLRKPKKKIINHKNSLSFEWVLMKTSKKCTMPTGQNPWLAWYIFTAKWEKEKKKKKSKNHISVITLHVSVINMIRFGWGRWAFSIPFGTHARIAFALKCVRSMLVKSLFKTKWHEYYLWPS